MLILNTNSHFGQQLRDIRINKKISQLDIANKIGCTPANITHFEKGDNTFGNGSIRTVFKYARALGYKSVKFIL